MNDGVTATLFRYIRPAPTRTASPIITPQNVPDAVADLIIDHINIAITIIIIVGKTGGEARTKQTLVLEEMGYIAKGAIAVSGLDDDLPGAVEAAVDWVIRLAESPLIAGRMVSARSGLPALTNAAEYRQLAPSNAPSTSTPEPGSI